MYINIQLKLTAGLNLIEWNSLWKYLMLKINFQ